MKTFKTPPGIGSLDVSSFGVGSSPRRVKSKAPALLEHYRLLALTCKAGALLLPRRRLEPTPSEKKHVSIVKRSLCFIKKHVFAMKKHVSFMRKHMFTMEKHVSFIKKHVFTMKKHVSFVKKHVFTIKKHMSFMKKHVSFTGKRSLAGARFSLPVFKLSTLKSNHYV
jgi:hypothetical protein